MSDIQFNVNYLTTIKSSDFGLVPRWGGLVVSVTAFHAVGHGFASRPGHIKNRHKLVQTISLLGTQALG